MQFTDGIANCVQNKAKVKNVLLNLVIEEHSVTYNHLWWNKFIQVHLMTLGPF